jgi:glycosyltransferase involved in cell wall biosynthesis
MARTRIAYVINSLRAGGGAERFLVDLVKHLPWDQFDPCVFCLYEAGELADQLTVVGVPVVRLGVSAKLGPEVYKSIYSALHGRDFEILHATLPAACWHALPAGWKAGIPVRIAHLTSCPRSFSLKVRVFDRLSFQFAHAAIACSQGVVNFYRRLMWYPQEKMHLVHNGVDTTRFEGLLDRMEARQSLGLGSEHLGITMVASLKVEKGHRYLLAAARRILEEIPNARFLLAGDGEDEDLRYELMSRCEQLRLGSSVSFLGMRHDVPNILAASDIFVLPSLSEGFGIALVEAGLAGLPSVGSNVDGISEVIRDGRNGFLVPPRDPDAIADAVLRLGRDPKLRGRLGAEGRQFAQSQFGIETAVQRILTIYHTLRGASKE